MCVHYIIVLHLKNGVKVYAHSCVVLLLSLLALLLSKRRLLFHPIKLVCRELSLIVNC